MTSIKNENYKEFVEKGQIKFITEDHIYKAMENINKHKEQGSALLILLYYTGCRPNEALALKGENVYKKNNYIIVDLPGSKKGLPRKVYLPYKRPLVKQFYKYILKLPPNMFMFFKFRGVYHRIRNERLTIEVSDKLRWHIYKWFDGVIEGSIPPYYLRHNRFSKLSEAGLTMEQLRLLKGSKTFASIVPYLHMSSDSAKKISKKLE